MPLCQGSHRRAQAASASLTRVARLVLAAALHQRAPHLSATRSCDRARHAASNFQQASGHPRRKMLKTRSPDSAKGQDEKLAVLRTRRHAVQIARRTRQASIHFQLRQCGLDAIRVFNAIDTSKIRDSRTITAYRLRVTPSDV